MKKTILTSILIFSFTLFVYLFVAGRFKWKFETTNFAYFNLLANSFLKKSWQIIDPPAARYDLTVFEGRVYLYWGALPSIVIMPLIAIFGKNLSDIIYTAFFGSLNVLLLFLCLLELNKILKHKINYKNIVLLVLFFAFGTVNFSSSVVGRVWFTSQVISLTAFLFSLFFLLKFLFLKKPILYFLAFVFLMAACAGRLTYLLSLPMYLLIILRKFPKTKLYFLISGLVLLIFFSLYAYYNHKRFRSFSQIGYDHQLENEKFLKLRNKHGRYSLFYLSQNIKYQIFNPLPLSSTYPFIKPNEVGNGLLFTSPLLILLLFSDKTILVSPLLKAFSLGALLMVIQILLFYGTGESQFGARYFLDVMPLLIFILALKINHLPKKVFYLLLCLSILFSSLGGIWFATLKKW